MKGPRTPTDRMRVRLDFVLVFDKDIEGITPEFENISWTGAIIEQLLPTLTSLGVRAIEANPMRRIELIPKIIPKKPRKKRHG